MRKLKLIPPKVISTNVTRWCHQSSASSSLWHRQEYCFVWKEGNASSATETCYLDCQNPEENLPDDKTLNSALRIEFLLSHQIALGLSTLLSLQAKPVASQGSTPLTETLLRDRAQGRAAESWAHLDLQPCLGNCLGSPNSHRISLHGFYQHSLPAPCTGHGCPLSTTPQQPLPCRVPFLHLLVPFLVPGGSQWKADRQEESFIFLSPLSLLAQGGCGGEEEDGCRSPMGCPSDTVEQVAAAGTPSPPPGALSSSVLLPRYLHLRAKT